MKNVSLYIDLAFCLVVLPIMVLIFPIERWFHNFSWYVLTVGGWLYTLYFINRFATVPFLFSSGKKRGLGVVMILLSFAVTAWISMINLYEPKPSIIDIGIVRILPSVQQYQQAVWTLFMIVETFSFAVGLLIQANIQKSRRRTVEAERDKAEIELYKAQIKPHFMFNTLNSLYGLFLTGNSKALESLEKFISMMRYIHTSSRRDFVSLADEADYIRQYVTLQSLRLNEMTRVTLDIDISNNDLKIPPMLLVTFVENCFKHGVSPVEKCAIRIRLSEHDGVLTFTTTNHIFPVKRIGEHMGIENCRRRLELLYPESHTMDISNDGETYNVKLSIKLSL
jgi:LytS/YehU family sensor histidine kinase